MQSSDAEPQSLAATVQTVAVLPLAWSTAVAVLWAGAASTLHRLQRGEGALLAVNLSLIVYQGTSLPRALVQALVSVLVLGLMYAFNDLYDAPLDSGNPKKDRVLIATYLQHRSTCGAALLVGKLLALALTCAALGVPATALVTAVMLANVVYSTLLKGVPVIDVVWCGFWGALYAAILVPPPLLVLMVGLMTAVCHLYQALDDRVADAASGIVTTAVRSTLLSRTLLATLCGLLWLTLRAPLGGTWALTAFMPLVLLFVAGTARTGWLLTKVYFGVVWLYLLAVV